MEGIHVINAKRSEIQGVLGSLVEKTNSTCTVLITEDGQIVTWSGNCNFINLTALGALVAGMFSATKEVARLLGEKEFSILFQQGQKLNIQISLIAMQMMLIVVFEGIQKTALIRLQTQNHSKAIIKLFEIYQPPIKGTGKIKPQDQTQKQQLPVKKVTAAQVNHPVQTEEISDNKIKKTDLEKEATTANTAKSPLPQKEWISESDETISLKERTSQKSFSLTPKNVESEITNESFKNFAASLLDDIFGDNE
jgi:predicted regulator of Ras-like GTPase activity (Roadblock/LC7/MglB family)